MDSATRSVIFNQGSLERRGQTQTNRCCTRERWPNSWSEGPMEGEGRGWAVLTLAGLLREDWTSYQTSYNTERWQGSFCEVTTHYSSKNECSVPAVAGQHCSLHEKRRPNSFKGNMTSRKFKLRESVHGNFLVPTWPTLSSIPCQPYDQMHPLWWLGRDTGRCVCVWALCDATAALPASPLLSKVGWGKPAVPGESDS